MLVLRYLAGATLGCLAVGVGYAQPQIVEVANGAYFQPALAPGSWASIFGNNLGPATATTYPADPTVLVGGKPGYVAFASPGQVNVEIPFELGPGATTLTLTYQGKTSAPFALTLLPYAPAILVLGMTPNSGIGAFQHANGAIVGPTPALPGETISCYLLGLGQTIPPVKTGEITPASPLSVAVVTPQVTVGGKPALVLFAGLTPGAVGNYVINFTVPGDMTPGLYSVVISSGGVPSNPVQLPVSITGLSLDRAGITFQAVQGGPIPPTAPIEAFIEVPQQPATVSASASTTSGGNWLSATPASVSAFVGASFTVAVNASGLTPGVYYGQLQFASPNAANSPQFSTIVLQVASAAAPPPPVLDQSGLLFLDVVGSTKVNAQTITITNLGTQPSPFTATIASTGAAKPFSVPVASGTITPGTPLHFTVQATTTGLAAGSYTGTLTLNFPQGILSVNLLFVVTPVAVTPANALRPKRVWESSPAATAACTPAKLLPVFSALGQGFTAPAGWPALIQANVVDDCGTPMSSGSVVAFFSNGDPPLALAGNTKGGWSAAWTPINTSSTSATITLTATEPDVGITGQARLGGSVTTNPGVPALTPGGVVDAASFSATATPSPGQLVSVFGGQLTDTPANAPSLPLPNQLGGEQLVIGGRIVPLYSVGPTQIDAILPYGLPVASTIQMVALRGNAISTPVPVSVIAGAPGIFTTNGLGTGQGHVYVLNGGAFVLADSNRPLKAGDVIVIYCGGLGEVSPPVTAGVAVPSDTLRNSNNSVTMTIGGVAAPVSFAGLTPGSAGLYQINATVPAGVPSGSAVPVVVTIGAVFSSPVMVAVQ